jgi:hypothetical protein
MTRKKITDQKENEVMTLPKDNSELRSFIKNNLTALTEQALSSIEFAVEHNLPLVEVFRFNNSDFVITISEKQFLENVNHIYNLYLESENYELCDRAVRLQSVLKNLNNSNEKETEENIENGTD